MKDQESDPQGRYKLQLFVTGASPNSVRAIANIKRICETHLPDNYDLEITDVYRQPLLAHDKQLVALPMLLKMHPHPVMRLVGDMSDKEKVLKGLGILPGLQEND
ncbi:circadian clock KaiB family protein [Ferruginibacter sp. HRS2-29]|uniref:circadian clock KaiB family protein n=1 Tax=Ferruginibacter sp. HRS2-29 TaxID=2487334 RepID=UPI0020CFBBB3|nr:circadian clock KaiB family protein [Ferruginibacter sp. HRS2-29]MCP9749885.1 circadian clock protein KaiB [Ferruginibacter sp. HRS2-29]